MVPDASRIGADPVPQLGEIPDRRRCAAVGCGRSVEPRYLFCRGHREALPCPALEALRRSARPGSAGSLRPSPEWIRAAAEAVEALARIEGRPAANPYRAAIGRPSPAAG